MFSNKISKLFLNRLYAFTLTSSRYTIFFLHQTFVKIIELNCNSSNLTSKTFGSYNFAKNLEEGLKSAKLESKPVILIVHKAMCGACKVLIPKLVASNDMKKLSDNFVMVNAFNGQDSKAKQYAPDGSYVPRFAVFFLNSCIRRYRFTKFYEFL